MTNPVFLLQRGFIYLVSVTGVTGARQNLSENLSDLVGRVKACSDTPVCVGFGISTPEQAGSVGGVADGVIVGSACVKTIGGSENPGKEAELFAKKFAEALNT